MCPILRPILSAHDSVDGEGGQVVVGEGAAVCAPGFAEPAAVRPVSLPARLRTPATGDHDPDRPTPLGALPRPGPRCPRPKQPACQRGLDVLCCCEQAWAADAAAGALRAPPRHWAAR